MIGLARAGRRALPRGQARAWGWRAAVLGLVGSGLAAVALPEPGPLTDGQRAEYGLEADFFRKGTVVEEILIATSGRVADVTHREAAYLFGKIMTSIKPEIASRVRARKVLCILLAHDELTSEVPQFKSDRTGEELDFYNWRQRGFLTTLEGRPVVLFAEEDVLEYEGGMQLESILIH